MTDGRIVRLTAAETLAHLDEIADVYRTTFRPPPHNETNEDAERFTGDILPRHAARRDFRCCVARAEAPGGAASISPIVGFVYGYTGAPGEYWHDLVAHALDSATAAAWLPGSFEVVVLAVAPPHQGHGLGAALLAALLDGLPNPTALLSTKRIETPARYLYRTRGWVTLAEPFLFPGNPAEYVVIGRQLPVEKSPM